MKLQDKGNSDDSFQQKEETFRHTKKVHIFINFTSSGNNLSINE